MNNSNTGGGGQSSGSGGSFGGSRPQSSVGNWGDVANVTPTLNNPSSTSGTSAVTGTILRAKIHVENWFEDGDYYELDCGAFEIDSCELSGPPNIFEIKAVSTPISSSIRRETKNRAWEDTTLEEIAGDIASGAGLQLMYEVREEIKLDRVDQLKSADLPYLQKLCRNYGVSLKVTNKRVVLFDEKDYEARPPIDQFDFSEVFDDESNPTGRITGYKFIQDTSDTVSSSNVAYKDPKSGQLVHYEFTPQDAPATGQAVNINNRPGYLIGDDYREALNADNTEVPATARSVGAVGGWGNAPDTSVDYANVRSDVLPNAKRQAEAKARDKNKGEWVCELTMVGDLRMVAGNTFTMSGFGVYDGKYMIDETGHKVSGGYTTDIKAHRVLIGY